MLQKRAIGIVVAVVIAYVVLGSYWSTLMVMLQLLFPRLVQLHWWL